MRNDQRGLSDFLLNNRLLTFTSSFVASSYTPNSTQQITMIAGGSGITPMIQVLRRIVSNPSDKTKVQLIYANKRADDILCRELLESWAKQYPEKLSIYYTLDNPPEKWTGGQGFVTESMLEGRIPKPGEGKIYVCGPPGMMNWISGDKAPDKSQGELSGLLKKLGYGEADVFKF